jgi:hypothetical protein
MKTINRRENPRIDVKLKGHVILPAGLAGVTLLTENISRTGLLVEWQPTGSSLVLPRVGQLLTVEIELPAHHGFGRKCMHCQGTVLRVSDSEAVVKVALTIGYMDFRSYTEPFELPEELSSAVTPWMA